MQAKPCRHDKWFGYAFEEGRAKKQNIIRHTGLLEALMSLLNTYTFFIKADRMYDDVVRGVEIFSCVMTILYFVTFHNKPNKKVVLSLMAPNRFEEYIYRSADFI